MKRVVILVLAASMAFGFTWGRSEKNETKTSTPWNTKDTTAVTVSEPQVAQVASSQVSAAPTTGESLRKLNEVLGDDPAEARRRMESLKRLAAALKKAQENNPAN